MCVGRVCMYVLHECKYTHICIHTCIHAYIHDACIHTHNNRVTLTLHTAAPSEIPIHARFPVFCLCLCLCPRISPATHAHAHTRLLPCILCISACAVLYGALKFHVNALAPPYEPHARFNTGGKSTGNLKKISDGVTFSGTISLDGGGFSNIRRSFSTKNLAGFMAYIHARMHIAALD